MAAVTALLETRALSKHFGGLNGLSKAGIEELMQVKGVSRELAQRIYATFHG